MANCVATTERPVSDCEEETPLASIRPSIRPRIRPRIRRRRSVSRARERKHVHRRAQMLHSSQRQLLLGFKLRQSRNNLDRPIIHPMYCQGEERYPRRCPVMLRKHNVTRYDLRSNGKYVKEQTEVVDQQTTGEKSRAKEAELDPNKEDAGALQSLLSGRPVQCVY
ncbi:hypothetical protein EYF80_042608 [Liparis tanakae]|uniref:Uncharacterized protein n=1 Tax=Liparis tanakae TaxID=230148 RepID=A0A4Z2G2R1_9TELE|nr:hypothetical protein EYF80_042608 [Liparis tanakae]